MSYPAASSELQLDREDGKGGSAFATYIKELEPSKIVMGMITAVILFVFVAPFLLVIVVSFGEKIEGASWVWGLDFSNYIRVFVGVDWPNSVTLLYTLKLYYTLAYAVLGSLIAVGFAFPFTYFMTQGSRRSQAMWLVFVLASLSMSEVFVVMGWDILLSNRSGLPALFKAAGITSWLKETGWLAVLRDWDLASPRNVKFKTSQLATVLTMAYLVWPYAVILLFAPLSRIDRSMIEAARTMGAGSITVLRTIVLPAVRLPVFGSLLLLFVYLLGTYVTVTYFAEPAHQTLPVSIYESIRGATLNAPFGAAQAVILLITAGIFIGFSLMLARLAERKA
ncbi:ABC transporter permease [Roseibium sp.]|uniref:ABC transporter permease n=1 Tax=Roseibium sp. TaxID=1936156 RepID=UPI003A97E308